MRLKRLAVGLAALGVALAAGCWAGPAVAPVGRLAARPPRVAALADGRGRQPALEQRAPAATISPSATAAPAATQPLAAFPAATATATAATPPTPAPLPASRVPILEYHYNSFEMLPSVMMKPEWFEAQMRWLAAAGFHTLNSAELAGFVAGSQPAPARSVALTFDVGASHFDEYLSDIVPTLRREHLRAIFFVMPSQTRDTCDGQTACWPSLLAWRDEGLISIESHSFLHEDYATLSPEMLAFDIVRSKRAIEARTGQPVLGLCYPFDSVTPAALDLLARAGYRYAVAGATRPDRSAQWGDPQPFALPRYYPYSGESTYPIVGGTHGLTFQEMMLGASE